MNWFIEGLFKTGIAFGGFASLVAAFTWFGKSLVNHFFSKDLEGYKTSLNKDLENHKNDLTTTKDKYIQEISSKLQNERFQFSSLHEKRAEVIPELYSKIQSAVSTINKFMSSDSKLLFDQAISEIEDAYFYFEKHKIYFKLDFCDKLVGFDKSLNEPLRTYMGLLEINYDSSQDLRIKKTESLSKVNNEYAKNSNEILEFIEDEFRRILGSTDQ